MMNQIAFSVHSNFPHNYGFQVLESSNLVNPTEELHQYPAQLEEGDRKGIYIRITPQSAEVWNGFFALGFDSADVASGIYSCPNPDSLCAVVGGYAYVVDTRRPQHWTQIEQRPVVKAEPLPELNLLLFVGFTSITGLDESGAPWTTERLSWEGLTISEIRGAKLLGLGWDMMTDKEVPFEVDLLTGSVKGGARPRIPPETSK